MVPVFEWLREDGSDFGLGTKVEFDHWLGEGTLPEGAKLGAVLCHEPATEDERRSVAWAA